MHRDGTMNNDGIDVSNDPSFQQASGSIDHTDMLKVEEWLGTGRLTDNSRTQLAGGPQIRRGNDCAVTSKKRRMLLKFTTALNRHVQQLAEQRDNETYASESFKREDTNRRRYTEHLQEERLVAQRRQTAKLEAQKRKAQQQEKEEREKQRREAQQREAQQRHEEELREARRKEQEKRARNETRREQEEAEERRRVQPSPTPMPDRNRVAFINWRQQCRDMLLHPETVTHIPQPSVSSDPHLSSFAFAQVIANAGLGLEELKLEMRFWHPDRTHFRRVQERYREEVCRSASDIFVVLQAVHNARLAA